MSDIVIELRGWPGSPARAIHTMMKAADEITRLRARVEELERDDRLPRPPEELVGALNDRIHPASGRLLNATPIHAKLKEAKP